MILFYLLLFLVAVQGFYVLFFFRHIFSLPGAAYLPADKRRPVSIIICAKDEAANLNKNLPSILAQRYTNAAGIALYEVIVVDDSSVDSTKDVLNKLQQQYDNLHVITDNITEKQLRGKKHALNRGVMQAAHDWLVFIDADCCPASGEWLEQMVVPLAGGKEIVVGYSGYNKTNGLLNAFIRWETLHTFFQYSTYALAGKPYMAVGRNMACTKTVFEQARQNEIWNKLPSGDDDLLVQIMGNAVNTAIVANKGAFTYSDAKQSWREWVAQKQRHLSTGKYYKPQSQFFLGLYGIAHAAGWLCFAALLFTHCWGIALAVMGVRCMVYWALWACAASRLDEKKLIYLFPFFDIAWMVYNFVFFPYITWKSKKHWK